MVTTRGIHRCQEMIDAEKTQAEIADLMGFPPPSPLALTVSLTRLGPDRGEFILGVCGGRYDLMVLVRFCPFCGCELR